MEENFSGPFAGVSTFGCPAYARGIIKFVDAIDLLMLGAIKQPVKMIGGGSNLLFCKPLNGVLVQRVGSPTIQFEGSTLFASAHAELDQLCAAAAARGIHGLENLSGIPGTLGGALTQNAGAYGAEISEVVEYLDIYDIQAQQLLRVGPEWMQYAYRSSRLKTADFHTDYIILEAALRLGGEPRLDYGNLRAELGTDSPTPENIRRCVLKMRGEKLPDLAEFGSCGSFFRNPEVPADMVPEGVNSFALPNGLHKLPAARLIDLCGLKGWRNGTAFVWPKQPLVIASDAGADTQAADVVAVCRHVQETVMNRFGIALEPEVELVGLNTTL